MGVYIGGDGLHCRREFLGYDGSLLWWVLANLFDRSLFEDDHASDFSCCFIDENTIARLLSWNIELATKSGSDISSWFFLLEKHCLSSYAKQSRKYGLALL